MNNELPFRIPDDPEFVRGMRLTSAEVEVLGRYIDLIEKAAKNPVDFARSQAVAFTPGAMLVVAVAQFAYQVYCDYGKATVTPQDIQYQWKAIAKRLAEIEARGEGAVDVDTYARLRRGLLAARQSK
jgi:hypothetical protein